MQQPQVLHLPGEPQVQTASFVLFLQIMGISQKQQGFGPKALVCSRHGSGH